MNKKPNGKSQKGGKLQVTSESFLRRVVENAGGIPFQLIFGSTVGNGHYSYIGDGIIDLLGVQAKTFTEDCFMGMVKEFIPLSNDMPFDPEECRKKMISGELCQYKADIYVRALNGEMKWLHDSSMPLRDEQTGKVIGAIGILMDITERKKAEDSSYQSQQMMQLVLDNIPVRVFWKDRGYSYLGCNKSFASDTGVSDPQQIIGKNDYELVWKENAPLYRADDRAVMESDMPKLNFEEPQKRADGSVVWLRTNKVPLHDRDGNAIGVLGTYEDITRDKQAKQALQDSEERYRSLFDRMMDGVYRSTHDGRFTEVNPAMLRMFGYSSKEEMLNIDIKKDLYFAPDDRDSLFLDTGQEKVEVFRMRRKDGSEIWVEDHGQYVHDAEGRVIYHEGILRDVTERLFADREIDLWKQRYELVAAASRQVVYDYNIAADTIAWSGSVKQVLGYDLAEMSGGVNQWSELIDPHDRTRVIRHLKDAQHNCTRYDVEYSFLHRDGHYVNVHDVGFFLADVTGRATRMIGVMQDITERKRADLLQNAVYEIAQAADRAATLEDLFRSVHEIVGTVMPAKNFYIALYDAEKDLVSFPYFVDEVDEPFPPSKPGKGLTAYILRTGKSLLCDEATDAVLRQRGEVELIGAPAPIWLGVPLIVENKTIGAMVVQHYSDASAYGQRDQHMLEYVSSRIAKAIEQKQAEERLRRSEEQFRLISENVADLIAVLDLDGRRLYNSPSYRYVLDDPQLLSGTDSFEEIHPEDREKIRRVFHETVRTGVGQRAEYRFMSKDGTIRHIESQASVIKDSTGKVSQVLVVSRDVTEKKKLEEQFLRSQRMESLGTLAGGIAHDLNNVLAPIMLSIQVLQKRIKDPEALKMLDTLNISAQRGSDVVKQVLAFARGIEGERMLLQPAHLLGEVVKISNETFPKSIEIHSEVPKSLWMLSADPTQIHQVLLNILVNARDAMPYGGKISITAENMRVDENYSRMNLEAKPGQYVRINISDTGTGIPPKIVSKIFEPFFTTKEVGKGTGLGLSTVLAIVKSHAGFVDVYSEVGKGTTFKIYLPAQVKEKEVAFAETVTEFPSGNGETILVVDDEASVREITKDTLETYGYKVLTANDGTEALALYAQYRSDIRVVLTDMMMPYMDGTATIRALQKINPGLHIIASSGMVPNEELMKSAGIVREFLNKPYTAEKLLKILNKVLLAK